MNAWRIISLFALISLLATGSGRAQQGPGQRRRLVDGQGRVYYRGPLRLTLGGGVALYSGDLTSGLADNFPGPSLSLGLLYGLRPHLLLGAEGSYFRMGARDQLRERGLAFEGTNGMGTVFVRYELLRDASRYAAGSQNGPPPLVQPYLKAGLGLLLYDPKSYLGRARPTASTSYLAPERNDYPALAGVAPLAAGLSVQATEQLRLTLEGAYYLTTTDHLDDVSTRGNPAQNDGFGTVELKVEYRVQR